MNKLNKILIIGLLFLTACKQVENNEYKLIKPESVGPNGIGTAALYKKGTNFYIIGNSLSVKINGDKPIFVKIN